MAIVTAAELVAEAFITDEIRSRAAELQTDLDNTIDKSKIACVNKIDELREMLDALNIYEAALEGKLNSTKLVFPTSWDDIKTNINRLGLRFIEEMQSSEVGKTQSKASKIQIVEGAVIGGEYKTKRTEELKKGIKVLKQEIEKCKSEISSSLNTGVTALIKNSKYQNKRVKNSLAKVADAAYADLTREQNDLQLLYAVKTELNKRMLGVDSASAQAFTTLSNYFKSAVTNAAENILIKL